MTTFLYIDYGASLYIGRELRYSLATLLAEYDARPARYDARPASVIVYTDKPAAYASIHPLVTTRDIAGDFGDWTRDGYTHRIKPCVLLDALKREGGLCVLVDTDSYIAEGFAQTLRSATAAGPAMDHREGRDPYPGIAGFTATLPHAGRYVYDPATAVAYNSGLIAAQAPRDIEAVEDAVALIDALWDAGRRLFKIEQIAVSEAFRLHGAAIGETRPAFQHYFRRSLKRYMHWRIDRWMRDEPQFRPQRPCIAHSRNSVRFFNYVNRLTRRY